MESSHDELFQVSQRGFPLGTLTLGYSWLFSVMWVREGVFDSMLTLQGHVSDKVVPFTVFRCKFSTFCRFPLCDRFSRIFETCFVSRL